MENLTIYLNLSLDKISSHKNIPFTSENTEKVSGILGEFQVYIGDVLSISPAQTTKMNKNSTLQVESFSFSHLLWPFISISLLCKALMKMSGGVFSKVFKL